MKFDSVNRMPHVCILLLMFASILELSDAGPKRSNFRVKPVKPELVFLRINVNFDSKYMSVDCVAMGAQPAPIDFQWRLNGDILNRTGVRSEEVDNTGEKVYVDTMTFGRDPKGIRRGIINCQVFHEGWKYFAP